MLCATMVKTCDHGPCEWDTTHLYIRMSGRYLEIGGQVCPRFILVAKRRCCGLCDEYVVWQPGTGSFLFQARQSCLGVDSRRLSARSL